MATAGGKKIALVVDNPFRDLPGLVLVAWKLAAAGATCFLTPMNLNGRELPALAPDFILLNYLRINNEELARGLAEAGVAFGVLDTEGGVLPDLDRYKQTLARDSAVRRAAARYFSWGRRLAEHAAAAGWFEEKQIKITGAPKYDFYREPWRRAALASSEEYAGGDDRPLVLLNGNFPLANPRFKTPEEEARLLTRTFGFDERMVADWQQTTGRAMRELAWLAGRLAGRFPEARFVYRPHPFENPAGYEGLLEERENLRLCGAGTVDGWILRAKAVIQRGCSTAIEAALSGVPALAPAWLPVAAPMPAADAVSVTCATEEELTAMVAACLKGTFKTPPVVAEKLKEVERDWFHQVDGKAHERVAAEISAVLKDVPPRRNRSHIRPAGGKGRGRLRRGVHGALRRLFRLPDDWSFRQWKRMPPAPGWENSAKYFGPDEVRRLLEAAREAAGEQDGGAPVIIRSAVEDGAYVFDNPGGRAVVLRPATVE